jgi:hypothetical protein
MRSTVAPTTGHHAAGWLSGMAVTTAVYFVALSSTRTVSLR